MLEFLGAFLPNIGNLVYLAAAALVAIAAAWIKGRMDGATSEKTRQKAKEADAHAKELDEIAKASAARSGVRPNDGVPDKYRRD